MGGARRGDAPEYVMGRSAVIANFRAASRIVQTSPPWAAVLARTAVLLGLASFMLRLVAAVVQASQDEFSGLGRL